MQHRLGPMMLGLPETTVHQLAHPSDRLTQAPRVELATSTSGSHEREETKRQTKRQSGTDRHLMLWTLLVSPPSLSPAELAYSRILRELVRPQDRTHHPRASSWLLIIVSVGEVTSFSYMEGCERVSPSCATAPCRQGHSRRCLIGGQGAYEEHVSPPPPTKGPG